MNQRDLQFIRNRVCQLVRTSNRFGSKIGDFRFGSGSWKHELKKFEICFRLRAEGKAFLTEAIFENGCRADILVLDDWKVIEVVDSETDESIESKKQRYPEELEVEIVRV